MARFPRRRTSCRDLVSFIVRRSNTLLELRPFLLLGARLYLVTNETVSKDSEDPRSLDDEFSPFSFCFLLLFSFLLFFLLFFKSHDLSRGSLTLNTSSKLFLRQGNS